MAAAAASIQIRELATETLAIPIVGTTPLIVHKFSEKAKRIMLNAQTGQRVPKELRDPQAEYEGAFHRLKDGRPGFPAIGFKAATVSAARYFGKDVSMVGLRQFMFFYGEPGEEGDMLVAIDGEPRMREDTVRVGQGTDLRYRPEFPEWKATLIVSYIKTSLNRDSLLSLIDAGGLGVGIGDWRPERRGDHGQYQIDPTIDVEVIRG